MRLHQIDLNLLVALEALLTSESVTAAARQLSVSQPAMSAALARLRHVLDDPVLIRRGRTMALSPYAQSVREPLTALLQQAQALLDQPRGFDPGTAEVTFSILASEHATIALLGRFKRHLGAVAPRMRLRLVPVSPRFSELLLRRDVDIAILPQPLIRQSASLASAELYRDSYVLLADPSSGVREGLTREEFSRLPYLAVTYEGSRALVDQHLDAAGIARAAEMSANVGTAPFLLAGTDLVAIIPKRMAMTVAPGLGLRVSTPQFPLPDLVETMVWDRARENDAGHRWLRMELSALAGDEIPVSEG